MKMMKSLGIFGSLLLSAGMLTGCSSGDSNGSSSASDERTQITVLGTIKTETGDEFAKAMELYNESQDRFEVVSIPLDGNANEKYTSLVKSGNAPTLMTMGQEASSARDNLMDVSDFGQLDYAIDGALDLVTDGDKVYGIPVSVEAFGLLYNQDVLDEAVGGEFDPTSINTQDELKELLDKIEETGVSAARVSALDWSLGAHLTSVMYSTQSESLSENLAFMDSLKAGDVDLMNNDVFNGWMDTLDILLDFNASKNSPLSPTYEQDVLALADGEVGVHFQGSWVSPLVQEINEDARIGIMPYPISNDADTYGNSQITAGVSLYWVIDDTQATEEEQEGALDFINWFLTSEEGQDIYVNDMGFISAYSNIELEPSDFLSQQVLRFINDGNYVDWLGMYYPADAFPAFGETLQKYISNNTDREGVAEAFESYWKSAS